MCYGGGLTPVSEAGVSEAMGLFNSKIPCSKKRIICINSVSLNITIILNSCTVT